jgi:pyrroline-5-carboxylate reductase
MKVVVVGLGRIGSALQARMRDDPRVTDILGTHRGGDNARAIDGADVVIVAVKPRDARAATQACAPALEDALLVSVCAGIRIADLREWSEGHRRIVRAMPNTPSLVGEGMTVLTALPDVPRADLELARSLFEAVGRTAVLDEELFDAVTALSGCGPAYIFSVIEALADAGAALAIPRDVALQLAAQTVLGSAKLLIERNADPAALRDEVATPGGATVEGLRVLADAGLHRAFVDAVAAAARRSGELRGK